MRGEPEALLRLLVDSVQDYGIFLLDPDGRIASWNTGAARINGYSEAEVLGRHFSLFYTPADVQRHYPEYELKVAAREGRFEDEGWRVRKNGSRFWANVIITALYDERGHVLGFGKVTRDLSARKQAEAGREELLQREQQARRDAEELAREVQDQAAALQEQTAEMEILNDELAASRTRLQATIDSSLDANVTTDAASIILEWNRHAETMFGWTAEEAVGRSLAETIIPPQHRRAHQRGVKHYLATGEGPILRQRIEITALRRDGTEFPVELTVNPAGTGKHVIFISFIRDLSERKRAESQRAAEHAVTRVLAESHTLPEAAPRVLQAIGEALGWPVGTFWLVDDAAVVLRPLAFWRDANTQADALEHATRQMVFAPGDGLPGRVWKQRAPAWIANIGNDINFPRAAAALRDGWHGAFGFPVFAGDEFLGVVEFFHRSALEPDAALLQSAEVIGRDIAQAVQRVRAETEEQRLRSELEAERARLNEIFVQVPALISVTEGPEHRIVLVNPAYQRMAGQRQLLGKTVREAFPEIIGQGFLEMRDRVYSTGTPHTQIEAPLHIDLDGDGQPEEHFLNFLTQPLRDAEGRINGILTFAVDVSAQVRARKLVEEQAAELEAQSHQLQEQAARLEEAQADLEATNHELRRINDELAARRQEAERARAEAEAANRSKSDFLANMSHELRTPINAVVGYADLMDMGIPDPATAAQKEQLEKIRSSSQHLLMLIEDILDFAKIEVGRVEVAAEPTRVGKPVNAALALIGPQAAERNLHIKARCEGDADRLFLGDEDRARQIVVNLLSNAVKFTEPGGSIAVACEAVRGHPPGHRSRRPREWVCVHVRDSGIGIAPEKQDAVFEPFVQVETERAHTRGGTGLGLSISRQLARLMGGELTLQSEVGKGSCFTLWLPATPVPPHSATPHSETK